MTSYTVIYIGNPILRKKSESTQGNKFNPEILQKSIGFIHITAAEQVIKLAVTPRFKTNKNVISLNYNRANNRPKTKPIPLNILAHHELTSLLDGLKST